MLKKEHKFFDTIIDNDLTVLYDYIFELNNSIINKNFLNLSDNIIRQYKDELSGSATQLGKYYNIFSFANKEINNLYNALKSLTIKACKYYEIDYISEKYFIHGWFNLDLSNITNAGDVSPLNNQYHFHDHLIGLGAPDFHGYYCVNAEPSTTYYKIGGKDGKLFNNININNRAIISETGHPHGRDDWYGDTARITIAYDIAPLSHIESSLNFKGGHIQWIPLITDSYEKDEN